MICLFIISVSHRTQVLSEMNCFQASLDFFVENWALDDFCVPVSKEVHFKVLSRPPALLLLVKVFSGVGSVAVRRFNLLKV